jgi:multiple sugar transport system substrate-binding protein
MAQRWIALMLAAMLVIAACSSGDDSSDTTAAGGSDTTQAGGDGGGTDSSGDAVCDGVIDGEVTVQAWNHAGQGLEQDLMVELVDEFNATVGPEKGVTVEMEYLPDGTYNEAVQSAAVAGELPDALDFDGPFLYSYAWSGNLVPIDSCLPADLRSDLLPSIIDQGTYDGKLYSVGYFDSGLGIYAWRSVLEDNGIRIPESPADAWTADEFEAALETLSSAGFEKALDIKWYYGGGSTSEWYTYGFSPVIQSAGADLIDRSTYQTAEGVVNSPEAVEALTRFQSWVNDGYVDLEAVDDLPFIEARIPLSWVGHWMYTPYKEALGDDLVVVPLPDFGQGSATGSGSWNWGISSTAEEPDAVWAWLEFLLSPEVQEKWSTAVGAPPATQSAVDRLPVFSDGGDLAIYIEQLKTSAVPRPQTPAYPTITNVFGEAFANIMLGADVQSSLDTVASEIDEDLEANDFYPTQ